MLSIYGAIGVLLIPRTGFAGMFTTKRGAYLALAHALLVYWYGAIVSEIWFHLLPVPLIVFGASNIVLRRHHQNVVFWLAALLLSFWEGRRIFTESELWVPIEIARGAVTYAANLSEIWLFRRFGFMTAVEQRLTSYAWWHILWPLAGKWVS